MPDTIRPAFPIQVSAQLPDIYNPGEDWTGIISTTRRRKLQNRLNQRARRASRGRRERAKQEPFLDGTQINEGRFLPEIYHTNGPYYDGDADLPPEDNHVIENQQTTEVSCLLGRSETRDVLVKLAQEGHNRYKAGVINTIDLSGVVRFNIFHAFALNARVLGFNDDWLTYQAISPFNMAGDALGRLMVENRPPMMEPTPLQLTVEHHPWIDFFPCPRLRENLLKAVDPGNETVDEDALCRDVIDAGARAGIGSAALLVWGNPWEPSGWEVTESFFRKWGWLLDSCSELIESTNYWRQKRGLRSLDAGCI